MLADMAMIALGIAGDLAPTPILRGELSIQPARSLPPRLPLTLQSARRPLLPPLLHCASLCFKRIPLYVSLRNE